MSCSKKLLIGFHKEWLNFFFKANDKVEMQKPDSAYIIQLIQYKVVLNFENLKVQDDKTKIPDKGAHKSEIKTKKSHRKLEIEEKSFHQVKEKRKTNSQFNKEQN